METNDQFIYSIVSQLIFYVYQVSGKGTTE